MTMKNDKKPKKPYKLDRILATHPQYAIIFGERSNGKSYAVKEYVLTDAFNGNGEFAYIRRWGEDIKTDMIESYFADMPIKKITKGKYTTISVYRKGIYFANKDESGKVVRGDRCGYAFRLTGETHYKSMAFPHTINAILEEFNTDTGYLPNEVDKLMSLVSTLFRRGKGTVFLVGNTISRLCPYFSEWNLQKCLTQKQGEIYEFIFPTENTDENGEPVSVKISCEYTKDESSDSKMFFGKSDKMITKGEWQTAIFPKLDGKLMDYNIIYTVLIEHNDVFYKLCLLTGKKDHIYPFVYVYPCSKGFESVRQRTVTKKFLAIDKFTTTDFTVITKYDRLILDAIHANHIRFANNLTGTEFYQMVKEGVI